LQGVESSTTREEARLKAAYERRNLQIPKNRYSYFSVGHLLAIQERERRVLALLTRVSHVSLEDMKILEIGCGTGFWLREFIKWGARPENIVGLDLLAERIEECRRLCPSGVVARCCNSSRIDSPADSFDLVLQSTVFSSVLDRATKRQMASEMVRVLRRPGIILWYDLCMNNPNNPDVRGIDRRELSALFPGCKIICNRITLAPPLARVLAPYARTICEILTGLRLLNTHLLAVISKQSQYCK
jgi:SAM-dependent methyltransferase